MESEDPVELFNYRVHFCAFLSTKHRDPMTRQIYEDIAKYGKIFDTCPLKKVQNFFTKFFNIMCIIIFYSIKEIYFLQDYHINEEFLPAYLPETIFKLTSTLYLNNSGTEHVIMNGLIEGRIDKSEGLNNMKIFAMG